MKFHLVFYTTTPGLNRSVVTTSVWDPFAICLHWISSSLISTYIITLPSLLKLQWLENLMEMFGVWSTNFHLKLIFSIKTIAAAAKELYSYEDSLQTTGVNARYTDPFCIFFFFFGDGLPSEVPERYKTMRSPNYYQNFQLPTTNQPQMETLCLPSMDPLSFPLFTQFVLML